MSDSESESHSDEWGEFENCTVTCHTDGCFAEGVEIVVLRPVGGDVACGSCGNDIHDIKDCEPSDYHGID